MLADHRIDFSPELREQLSESSLRGNSVREAFPAREALLVESASLRGVPCGEGLCSKIGLS